MICPMLGGQCVKRDCALWFQEVDENEHPVVNMCGCSIAMAAQYLMEFRPEIMSIRERAEGKINYIVDIKKEIEIDDGHQRSP